MTYNWGPSAFSGDLRPLYKDLAASYRLLIYSGDTDGCVPTWGTDEWVRELGFGERRGWHAWESPLAYGAPSQRAGYAIEYETALDFSFVTVQVGGWSSSVGSCLCSYPGSVAIREVSMRLAVPLASSAGRRAHDPALQADVRAHDARQVPEERDVLDAVGSRRTTTMMMNGPAPFPVLSYTPGRWSFLSA